jgi:DNA processing protein
MKNGSKTIAVLGCGIDYDYPQDNAKLKKVLAKSGAVITEYFPGTKPFYENFKQRNRLISGLSLGVLVVEASSKSGSLNTASHALQQGKDIFCIPPHDIFDERYIGVCNLLRDGAIPVFSHLDIMYEYFENFSHKTKENKVFDNFFVRSIDAPEISNINNNTSRERKNKKQKKAEKKEVSNNNLDYSDLSGTKRSIIELLADGTYLADEISKLLKIDISEVLFELTELELEGYVKALAGKRYSL